MPIHQKLVGIREQNPFAKAVIAQDRLLPGDAVMRVPILGVGGIQDDVRLAGAPGPFSLVGERTFTLQPGESREVVVRYAPEVPGVTTIELQVESDDPDRRLSEPEVSDPDRP